MSKPTVSQRVRAEAKSRLVSFRFAFEGIAYVFRTQHNLWIHTLATVLAIGFGVWLELGRTEWAILVLTFVAVFVAEFLNTAVEAVVDLASPEYHRLAKVAKDAAAGGVLIAALGSVIVGLLILGPPLWEKLFG